MKTFLSWCVAIGLAAAATTALALPGTFSIQQIFSNADGTVQFVVIYDRGQNDCDSGEAIWAGQTLASEGAAPLKTFVFPSNLPTCATSNHRILIATDGFAALGIVSPDFVIPDGFIQIPNGTLYFAGISAVTYTALPNDGVTAILADGTPTKNLATNLAGKSASVTAPAAPAAIIPVAGVWWNKDEPGSGYGLDVNQNVLILTAYSFVPAGTAQWYLATGNITNNVFQATLDKYMGGQCISCMYAGSSTLTGNDGQVTITFTSPTTATISLPGGRVGHIERYFGPGAAPSASAPVPGVWWNANEPGTGYVLDYQNGVLLFEAYSFLPSMAAQWYLAVGNVTNNVFQATLDKYIGGQCISCAYTGSSTVAGNDGQVIITFTSPTTATIVLPGGRAGQIRTFFSP